MNIDIMYQIVRIRLLVCAINTPLKNIPTTKRNPRLFGFMPNGYARRAPSATSIAAKTAKIVIVSKV
ncbi:hypothetical protein JCM31271_00030 [Halorubrum trueperi]